LKPSLLPSLALCGLAAACSVSTTGGGSPPPGPSPTGSSSSSGGPTTPSCADGDATVTLTAAQIPYPGGGTQLATHTVYGVVNSSNGPSVLVGQNQSDLSEKLSFVDQTGNVTDVASIAGVIASNGGSYPVVATGFVLGQKRCAAFVKSGDTLKLACEGVPVEDSTIQNVDADKTLLALVHADGSLSLYGQAFSAYDELDRSSAGAWHEVQKYESSISYPESALLHAGQAFTCYIDDGGYAVLDVGGSQGLASSAKASHCRIAAGTASLHVLADDAYAAVAWGSLSAATGQGFGSSGQANMGAAFSPTKGPLTLATTDQVVALAVSQETPWAVVDRGTRLEGVPLTGNGATVQLGPGDVKGTSYDDTAGALRFVTVTTDDTSGVEKLDVATRCASDLH
jgi:hypothetical protein